MTCPECGEPVEWNEEYSDHAYRHIDSESRWCTGTLVYPRGCTDKENPAYTRKWRYFELKGRGK